MEAVSDAGILAAWQEPLGRKFVWLYYPGEADLMNACKTTTRLGSLVLL